MKTEPVDPGGDVPTAQPEWLNDFGIEFTKLVLTPLPLPGKEPDRGYQTPDGRRFRAHVAKTDSRTDKNPNPDADEEILHTSHTLTVTIAELDEDSRVKRINGKLALSEPHEIPFNELQLSRPGFDLAKLIDDAIHRLVVSLMNVNDNRDAVAAVTKEWGIEL